MSQIKRETFLTAWLLTLWCFIGLCVALPAAGAVNSENKILFYIPMFFLTLLLLVGRLVIADTLCETLVMLPAPWGCALLLTGATEYHIMTHGPKAVGSLRLASALLVQQPPPTRFYFTDGFVADALSQEFCSGKTHAQNCATHAIAPVFHSHNDAFTNHTPLAWAVPSDGRIRISADNCEVIDGGQGGLCGILPYSYEPAWGVLAQEYWLKHPMVNVTQGLPYFLFLDPARQVAKMKMHRFLGAMSLIAVTLLTIVQLMLPAIRNECRIDFVDDAGTLVLLENEQLV